MRKSAVRNICAAVAKFLEYMQLNISDFFIGIPSEWCVQFIDCTLYDVVFLYHFFWKMSSTIIDETGLVISETQMLHVLRTRAIFRPEITCPGLSINVLGTV